MPKSIARLVSLLALIFAVLLPSRIARSDEAVTTLLAPQAGVVLLGNAESPVACRLVVQSDDATFIDRGVLTRDQAAHPLVGSFRLWQEPGGRMLYVYDDAQNLMGRIVNPCSVVLLGVSRPTP